MLLVGSPQGDWQGKGLSSVVNQRCLGGRGVGANTQVLIVGAGPTGLVLALWLARLGVSFRLIDKNAGPGEASRAMAVQARTLEFYRQLGFVDEVLARGFQMRQLHVRNESREIARINLVDVGKGESPYPFALSFPQDDHERFLNAQLQLAGAEIEWRTQLLRFVQDEAGVRAVLSKDGLEQSCEVAYLCGCDGAHSTVRQELQIQFPGGTYDQLFYVADVQATGPWRECDINVYVAPKTFCAAFPVRAAGMFRLIGLVPAAFKDREEITFGELREGVERVTGVKVKQVHWFSTYRVHHRVAERFREGRAFLCGDAGHVHSPAGGQGMNTGIGDAVNLAWKLAAVLQQRALPEVLDSYEAERISFARSLVSTTDRFFEAVVGKSLLARLVRAVVAPYLLPCALRFSAVRRAQFRLVSQTRIAYRNSPLSVGAVRAIHGGDRLPWVEDVDNFTALQALDWQIHIYGDPTPALREFACGRGLQLCCWPWSDDARRAKLERNALYLVRPDGYLGLVHPSQDVERVRSYLARFAIEAQSGS